MKHSSTWFALILILLASLPSAAKSANLPTEQNKNLPSKQESKSEGNQSSAGSASSQTDPQPSSVVSKAAANKKQDNSYHPRPEANAADLVIAVVTSVYVIVSFFTLLAIKRQSDIFVEIESPFLSVNFTPHFKDNRGEWLEKPWMEYWFENTGRTPATLSDSYAEFKLVTDIGPIPEYGESRPYPRSTIGIAPNGGKSTSGTCRYTLQPEDRILLATPEIISFWVFYGFVQYEGLPNTKRIVGFGFYAPTKRQLGGFSLIHSEKYNYRREYKKRWFDRLYKSKTKLSHIPLPL